MHDKKSNLLAILDFFLFFDHENICTNMRSLVKIHNSGKIEFNIWPAVITSIFKIETFYVLFSNVLNILFTCRGRWGKGRST